MSNYLDPEKVDQYRRDGFVILDGLFSEAEVKRLIEEIEAGSVDGSGHLTNDASVRDAYGRTVGIAYWLDLADDLWSGLRCCPRLVNNCRTLLGEEISFFHGKVILKERGSGGTWEWHQDYGYYYDQGFIFLRQAQVCLALDKATIENGYLQVLRGSHKLGRISHGTVGGGQTGADPEQMAELEPLFEKVYVELEPGSVLFFHPLLFHGSGPNDTDRPPRSVIIVYTATAAPVLKSNALWKPPERRPLSLAPDDIILNSH